MVDLRSRASGALLGLLCTMAMGCGGRDGSTDQPTPAADSESTAESVAALRLRVQLLEAPPALRESMESWAAERGVQLELQVGSALPSDGKEPPVLLEVDAFAFAELAAAGHLRPLGEAAERARQAQYVADAGQWEGEAFGVPWRGEVHGLAIPQALATEAISWSSLARWCAGEGGLATPPGEDPSLLALFLGARWTVSETEIGEGPEGLWSGDPSAEALAYVQRLTRKAERVDARAMVEGLRAARFAAAPFDATLLAAIDESGAGATMVLAPFPEAGRAGKGVCWVRPRLLVLPRGGAYRDLAEELVERLSTGEGAQRLAAITSSWALPMARDLRLGSDVRGSVTRARALALRVFARALPAPWMTPRLQDVLVEATDATLALRRSPQDALADAAARWARSSGDGR